MSLSTQETLLIHETIGHIIAGAASKLSNDGGDVTQILDMVTGLAEMDPDHPINAAMKKFEQNEVFVRYYSNMEPEVTPELLYNARCVLLMLVSEVLGRGFNFKTPGEYDVRVVRSENTFAISYYCDLAFSHTVALDIWEVDLQIALQEVHDRIDWIYRGHNVQSYPLKVKNNHYRPLKEQQP